MNKYESKQMNKQICNVELQSTLEIEIKLIQFLCLLK